MSPFRCFLAVPLLLAASAGGAAVPAGNPSFQPNLGQLDPQVAFFAENGQAHLFVTRGGELVHRFPMEDGAAWAVVERFDAVGELHPASAEADAARLTFIGRHGTQSAAWVRRVDLGEPWRGIRADLVATDSGYEKRFHLAPGTDAAAIRMALVGVDDMQRSDDGRLRLGTGAGTVEMSAPIAWQDIDGRRAPVKVSYRLLDAATYGFALGAHDPAHGVVIDPIIRSTFSGGNRQDSVARLVVDGDDVYVAGTSYSTNFPGVAGGYQPSLILNGPSTGFNAFVARYSLDLTELRQATYFGEYNQIPNSGGQWVGPQLQALAVAADGVYLAGNAPGRGGGHVPGTAGGAQPVAGNTSETGAGNYSQDGWVAKLSRDLASLMQATYFGGTGSDTATAMALGADGIYIAGISSSGNLPGLEHGAHNNPADAGSSSPYVAKLALDLRSIFAASWAGTTTGAASMYVRDLAVSDDGDVYVGGDGFGTLFPSDTAGAFQPLRAATGFRNNAFVVRLSSDLGTVHRATWFGGTHYGYLNGLALGDDGAVYFTGDTQSTDFPVAPNAAQPSWNGVGGTSAIVAALSSDLSTRIGATYYFGQDGYALPRTILTHDGDVFIAGTTISSTLPATEGGAQSTHVGNGECSFALRLNPGLSLFRQATYLACYPVVTPSSPVLVYAMDYGNDTLYFGGSTTASTLPGIQGAAQPTYGQGGDGFILAATIDLGAPRPIADLAVTKVGSEYPIAKRWVLYDIGVTNLGPDAASDARIQDALPPELVAAGWTCTASAGAACTQASGSGAIDMQATLPVGGTLTFALCGRSAGASLIVNTAEASVSDAMLDPVSENNHASAVTQDDSLFGDGFEDTSLPPWCPPAG